MKLKNYIFHGFGFPVIFDELPAVRLRGELVPDIDFSKFSTDLIKYICINQEFPLSGHQVKFFRHSLNLSMREFAKLVGVKHQSIMRWESNGSLPAKMEAPTEIVLRLLMLNKFKGTNKQVLDVATRQVQDVAKLKATSYKKFEPIRYLHSLALLNRYA